MDNKQLKVLFADLYRLNTDIKDELKFSSRSIADILDQTEWETFSMVANSIANNAEYIKARAQAMIDCIDIVMNGGDYGEQTATMRPLELLAAKETAENA